MFKFVKKKMEKGKELLEQEMLARKEKEIQDKINVKKTLSSMKNQLLKLEKLKQSYIEKAKNASLIGDSQGYKLAKSGLKICLSKQKTMESMVSNFEILMQLKDCNKIFGSFAEGMNIISEQLSNATQNGDIIKAQMAYEKALANNESQSQAIDAFLATAYESITNIEGVETDVSDEEIDSLITNGVIDAENDIDTEINNKITDIHSKLNMQGE